MELPPLLRRAVDNALNGTALSDLAATAAALSDRYREERHDIKPRVISDREALAYLAVRLPATYAAIRTSFNAVAEARPDFMPGNALEVGAGPGTALWAAAECWPAVSEALLVEASPIFRTYGERLAAEAELPHVTWRVADIAVDAIDSKPRDLVTMAYVLNELAPKVRHSILQQLWQLTADTLVIVEPGTPAGWQRIIAARNQLIEAGAHVIAPCPHARACPLQPRTGATSPSASPARASIDKPNRGRPLGRREVQLCGGLAKAGCACPSARYCTPTQGRRAYYVEAVPSRRLDGQSVVLAPRRPAVQACLAHRLGLVAMNVR
jgi:ribosomal protein RSM22 (predicted rRNA methylase)